MFIENRSMLGIELLKIKDAIAQKNINRMNSLYDYYHSLLKSSSEDFKLKGFMTFFSPKISYHLLSVHFILDYIEHFYDGSKIYDKPFTKPPLLYNELGLEQFVPYPENFFEEMIPTLTKLEKLTKHQLNVFFYPYQHSKNFLLEYTIIGDILILFSSKKINSQPNELQMTEYRNHLLEGLSHFYLKKELKNNVPHFFQSEKHFHQDLINWYSDKKSIYFR